MNTTDTRRPLDTQAVGLMLLLCLIWSLQQIVLKATALDFSPTLQLALRSGIAAVLVWLYMRSKGEQLTLRSGIWHPASVKIAKADSAATGINRVMSWVCVMKSSNRFLCQLIP